MNLDAMIRIWDGKEMSVGHLSDLTHAGSEVRGKVDESSEDSSVIMFATGRTDTDGNSIYASDVVEHAQYPEQHAVIEWSDQEACYRADWLNEEPGFSGNMEHAKSWRVIGNLFENPELAPERSHRGGQMGGTSP